MKGVFASPWFQLCALVAVVSGGITVFNQLSSGAYSGGSSGTITAVAPSPGSSAQPVITDSVTLDFLGRQLRTAAVRLAPDSLASAGLTMLSGRFLTATDTNAMVLSPEAGKRLFNSPSIDPVGSGALVDGHMALIVGLASPGAAQPAALQAWLIRGRPPAGSQSITASSGPPDTSKAASAGIPGMAATPASVPPPPPASIPIQKPTRDPSGALILTSPGTVESGALRALAVSPDGKAVATTHASRRGVIWDAATGVKQKVATLPDSFGTPLFTASGRALVVVGSIGEVHLYDLSADRELRRLPLREGYPKVFVKRAWLAPDDRTLVFGTGAGTVVVWDIISGTSRSWHMYPDNLQKVASLPHYALAPDLSAIATTEVLQRSWPEHPPAVPVTVWDLASGRKLRELTGHTGAVFGLGWTADSRTVLAEAFDSSGIPARSSIVGWGTSDWSLRTVARLGGTWDYGWMEVSPDGRFLVVYGGSSYSAEEDQAELKVIDLGSGGVLRTTSPPPRYGKDRQVVKVVAWKFTPDSRSLVAGYSNGAIMIHPVP